MNKRNFDLTQKQKFSWVKVPYSGAWQCNHCNFTEWNAIKYKHCPQCGAIMTNGGAQNK